MPPPACVCTISCFPPPPTVLSHPCLPASWLDWHYLWDPWLKMVQGFCKFCLSPSNYNDIRITYHFKFGKAQMGGTWILSCFCGRWSDCQPSFKACLKQFAVYTIFSDTCHRFFHNIIFVSLSQSCLQEARGYAVWARKIRRTSVFKAIPEGSTPG